MSVEEKLKEMGLELPPAPAPMGNYIGAKWAGNIAFSCGQGPFRSTKRGMVGQELTVEEGYQAARETCLNYSAEGFMQQPAVLNGFTDLLVELFGNPGGKPARAALPVHHPGWIALEAWMVVELKE